MQKVEPEGEASPTAAATTEGVVSGEPIWTLESLLQAAAKVAGAQPATTTPAMRVVSIRTHTPMSGAAQAYALVDSGATHALRRANSQEEWNGADPVTVNLAGGETVALRINKAGTILVPITNLQNASSTTPIVPLGALVQQLGYTMTWSGTRCKLESKSGEIFHLRVREGCPELAEQDALQLISRLEDNNLRDLESHIRSTRRKVKTVAMMMDRTWFDSLQAYVRGGISTEAMRAIDAAPFFREVPAQCLYGLVEAVPETNGWEILRGLQHLNRRTRKKLWSSDKWVVHLFSVIEKSETSTTWSHMGIQFCSWI